LYYVFSSKYIKMRWPPGIRPGPRWGAHDTSLDPLVGFLMTRAFGALTHSPLCNLRAVSLCCCCN